VAANPLSVKAGPPERTFRLGLWGGLPIVRVQVDSWTYEWHYSTFINLLLDRIGSFCNAAI